MTIPISRRHSMVAREVSATSNMDRQSLNMQVEVLMMLMAKPLFALSIADRRRSREEEDEEEYVPSPVRYVAPADVACPMQALVPDP